MGMDEAMAHTVPRPSSSRSVSPASSDYSGSERGGRSPSASPPEPASSPNPMLVQAYTDLMASLIPSAMTLPPGDIAVGTSKLDTVRKTAPPGSHDDDHDDHDSAPPESGRALTKAEKQNAKKKRRKERERAARLEEELTLAQEREEELAERAREEERKRMVTSFRLFSSCPIQKISLLPPVEDYPVPPNPRHLPQSQDIAHRIRRIAHESAVDPSSFAEQNLGTTASSTASAPTSTLSAPAAAGPLRMLRAEGSVPPCFVAEIPRDHHSPAEYLSTPQSTLLPHHPRRGGLIKHIPLNPVSATEPNLPNEPNIQNPSQTHDRSRRRRRRRRVQEYSYDRPAPRFFAPPSGLGGKSRGYAWGWRDSFEGRREDGWEGYLRS